MDCNKLPLRQLASGELPLPASLLLHWHVMRCPCCRTEYRRSREILSQLRGLAQGPGRHEIRSKEGALLGYAVIRPLTEKDYLITRGLTRMMTLAEELDRQARDWADPNWDTHGGASGSESAAWGVRGFDVQAGLR